jgi:AP-1 complex subunit gamma-1
MYTVGLALCTLGNIASAEMARDLSPEVEKLLNSSNSYIKKKVSYNCLVWLWRLQAALCAIKMLKKVPDMVDQFVPKAKVLIGERNHAVLLTGMSLTFTICEISPEALREFRTVIIMSI